MITSSNVTMESDKKPVRRKAKLAVFSRFYQTAIRLSAKGITPGKKLITFLKHLQG